jgi:hypothetical protein
MNEILEVGGLAFEVRRSSRRRTLGLTVDRGGELVMHAPLTTSQANLSQWAETKLLWIQQKLALKESSTAGMLTPEYVTGEIFSYLGRRYRLVLVEKQRTPLVFDGEHFLLHRNARPADAHFRRWYLAAAKEWLPQRIALLQPRAGRQPTRLVVRDLGFHWGSCGRDGGIYLNWRLLQLSTRLVDYVLIHELCHLIEPSHNREFRRALERALPDWQEREAQLNGAIVDIFWCSARMRR